MDELKKALRAADEAALTELANKGIYKRACKDIEGGEITSRDAENGVIVDIGGETVTVTVPLSECRCSCVSRTVCRHIIGAIVWLRNGLPVETEQENIPENKPEKAIPAAEEKAENNNEGDTENEPQKPLRSAETAKINSCAADHLDLLGDIFRQGIVRLPRTVPDTAEVAAVRCHALKMADGERMMRELSGRLSDFLSRRASFSTADFTTRFFRAVRHFTRLCEDDITASELGVFRQTYETHRGDLNLLPIGQRTVAGVEHEGEIYYFLDLKDEEHRFLSFSDLRPVFYDTAKRRSKAVFPWDLTASLRSYMHKVIVLAKAKLSGGRLSSSGETHVVMTLNADLNCNEMRSRIYCDLRQAAVELHERHPVSDLDRLMLIHPKRCLSSGFDKITQTYTMTVEDAKGFPAYIRVRYRAEAKELVELLEKIGKKMTSETEKRYTILALGELKSCALELYPVEIYDHITPPCYDGEYELPEEYEVSGDDLRNSRKIYELILELRERLELMVQCGIAAVSDKLVQMENACFNYGLKGLSRLCGELGREAEMYRHDPSRSMKKILETAAELEDYLTAAAEKLEIILTVNRE